MITKQNKNLLKKIDSRYKTSFLSDNTFIPFIQFDFVVNNSLVIDTDNDNFLDHIIAEGDITFVHMLFHEEPYEVKLKSLDIVDLFYHTHQGIIFSGDKRHRFLEALEIKKENNKIKVSTFCGS